MFIFRNQPQAQANATPKTFNIYAINGYYFHCYLVETIPFLKIGSLSQKNEREITLNLRDYSQHANLFESIITHKNGLLLGQIQRQRGDTSLYVYMNESQPIVQIIKYMEIPENLIHKLPRNGKKSIHISKNFVVYTYTKSPFCYVHDIYTGKFIKQLYVDDYFGDVLIDDVGNVIAFEKYEAYLSPHNPLRVIKFRVVICNFDELVFEIFTSYIDENDVRAFRYSWLSNDKIIAVADTGLCVIVDMHAKLAVLSKSSNNFFNGGCRGEAYLVPEKPLMNVIEFFDIFEKQIKIIEGADISNATHFAFDPEFMQGVYISGKDNQLYKLNDPKWEKSKLLCKSEQIFLFNNGKLVYLTVNVNSTTYETNITGLRDSFKYEIENNKFCVWTSYIGNQRKHESKITDVDKWLIFLEVAKQNYKNAGNKCEEGYKDQVVTPPKKIERHTAFTTEIW
jgi:hypothetical protein